MELMTPKLIETLCALRSEILKSMSIQISSMKRCHELCAQMDRLIPISPSAYIDSLDVIFLRFRQQLGETNAKQISPRDHDLLSVPLDKLLSRFKKILDQELWAVIFNRLNIFSLMSASGKQQFRKQNKTQELEFTLDNVEATFLSLIANKDSMMINSLLDCVILADKSYVSNDSSSFKKRTIFTNEIYKYGSFIKLKEDHHFKDFISFFSRIILGNATVTSEDKQIKDVPLWQEIRHFFKSGEFEVLDREEFEFQGGKAVFFNNGNVHLCLDVQVVSFLNDLLNDTRTLK